MSMNIEEQLFNAVADGDVEKVRAIFAAHPELTGKRSSALGTWLHLAARHGHLPLVEMLVSSGMDLNAPCSVTNAETPLHHAARQGHVAVARWLLNQGANVNSGNGATPLIKAVFSGSLEMVMLLVEHGADVNTSYGTPPHTPHTPLRFAISEGQHAIANFLQEKGAIEPAAPQPSPGKAAGTPREQIIKHVSKAFGPAAKEPLLTDAVPGVGEVAVHAVHDEERITLFTTGISDKAMKVPKGKKAAAHVELLIDLPPDWPLTKKALKDEANLWPVDWLRVLAHYVHEEGACLADGDTIGNEEPPKPFASGTKLSCLLTIEDQEVEPLKTRDGRRITFLRVFPIYVEERDLCRSKGVVALVELFEKHEIDQVVDPKRPNVAVKAKKAGPR